MREQDIELNIPPGNNTKMIGFFSMTNIQSTEQEYLHRNKKTRESCLSYIYSLQSPEIRNTTTSRKQQHSHSQIRPVDC